MTLDWLLVCATLTGIFVLGFVLGIAVPKHGLYEDDNR